MTVRHLLAAAAVAGSLGAAPAAATDLCVTVTPPAGGVEAEVCTPYGTPYPPLACTDLGVVRVCET